MALFYGRYNVFENKWPSYKKGTFLALTFADFAVFDKVRENFYSRKMLSWKILSFLGNFGDFLQHFDGESAKIYTREIGSLL